jgi:MarR family transcriptional regulator, organic hydroperoxide resistance regulator
MAAHKESDPAVEAWSLMTSLVFSARPRMFQAAQEVDLHPGQLRALQLLDPDSEVPMSALAGQMFCDASNVTGIVDRLEGRGLIERRPSKADRRVKMLAVTDEGRRVREQLHERLSQPPPQLAALSPAQQRTLRDALRAATDGAEPEAA